VVDLEESIINQLTAMYALIELTVAIWFLINGKTFSFQASVTNKS